MEKIGSVERDGGRVRTEIEESVKRLVRRH